jgi:nucleoside-diphosphate-sugar epimerase
VRIFLTGGTGYIGSNLARSLINIGFEVAILKRESSDLTEYLGDISDSVKFFDYKGNYDSVDNAIDQFAPDAAIHLASYYTFSHTKNEIDVLVDSNIRLGLYLLESMTNHNVKYLINTGTSFEHYMDEGYNPVNLYAATKHAFENLIRFYTECESISCVTLKLFDTYGPGDKRKKLIWMLKEKARNGEEINLSGGEQVVDFVYIEDVVNAFIQALENISHKPIGFFKSYGVSSGERMTLKRFIGLFEEVYGKKLNVNFGKLPYRSREVMIPWKKFSKLQNWMPKVSLKRGLKKVLVD